VGDLLLMDMFCWHAATGPGARCPTERLGFFNKYRAATAPPACGPNLVSSEAAAAMARLGHPGLLPHHAADPRRALVAVRLLLVDGQGKIHGADPKFAS
jgi:hypothetical protein